MEKQIYISEDVIAFVARPISLFLNDVPTGVVYTHNPLPALHGAVTHQKKDEYGIINSGTGADKKVSYPTFVFKSIRGGLFKFTLYDVQNFKHGAIPFKEYFVPEEGKKLQLQTSFTVVSCEPLLNPDGTKRYPLFCYEGYNKYYTDKIALGKDADTTDILETLKKTDIKAEAIERYYRLVALDNPIFYYPESK
jgi:hypothetical protein